MAGITARFPGVQIDDATWRELKAARAQVDSWAQFGGLLHINEKTARAWVEDRSRDVRPKKLHFALSNLRKARSAIKADTKNARGTETSPTESVTPSYLVVAPPQDGADVPKPGEGVQMVLTRQQSIVCGIWQEYGFERAMQQMKEIEHTRSRLQQRDSADAK